MAPQPFNRVPSPALFQGTAAVGMSGRLATMTGGSGGKDGSGGGGGGIKVLIRIRPLLPRELMDDEVGPGMLIHRLRHRPRR